MAAYSPWLKIYRDAWLLGLESATVMGLRGMTLAAGGPAAQKEQARMIAEKIDAGLTLQRRALSGALGLTPEPIARKTLSHYRKRVRANRRRLIARKFS